MMAGNLHLFITIFYMLIDDTCFAVKQKGMSSPGPQQKHVINKRNPAMEAGYQQYLNVKAHKISSNIQTTMITDNEASTTEEFNDGEGELPKSPDKLPKMYLLLLIAVFLLITFICAGGFYIYYLKSQGKILKKSISKTAGMSSHNSMTSHSSITLRSENQSLKSQKSRSRKTAQMMDETKELKSELIILRKRLGKVETEEDKSHIKACIEKSDKKIKNLKEKMKKLESCKSDEEPEVVARSKEFSIRETRQKPEIVPSRVFSETLTFKSAFSVK